MEKNIAGFENRNLNFENYSKMLTNNCITRICSRKKMALSCDDCGIIISMMEMILAG